MGNYPRSVYKTFLIFSSILLTVGVLLWFKSPTLSLQWGVWNVPSFQNMFPFIVVALGVLSVFVFQREIQLAKTQQKEESQRNFIRILRIENQSKESEIANLKDLVEDSQLAEDRINSLWKQVKEKVQLSQLYELPEFALFLIEKVVDIKDELDVVLETEIKGDLTSLKRVNSEDLKNSVGLLIEVITEQLRIIPSEERTDISLSIREKAKHVSFNVVYDYEHNPINCEMLEWNVKKLLHRYNGQLKIIQEKEGELNTLVLKVEIPKEGKQRKII